LLSKIMNHAATICPQFHPKNRNPQTLPPTPLGSLKYPVNLLNPSAAAALNAAYFSLAQSLLHTTNYMIPR
jgi:hypothetical protein